MRGGIWDMTGLGKMGFGVHEMGASVGIRISKEAYAFKLSSPSARPLVSNRYMRSVLRKDPLSKRVSSHIWSTSWYVWGDECVSGSQASRPQCRPGHHRGLWLASAIWVFFCFSSCISPPCFFVHYSSFLARLMLPSH